MLSFIKNTCLFLWIISLIAYWLLTHQEYRWEKIDGIVSTMHIKFNGQARDLDWLNIHNYKSLPKKYYIVLEMPDFFWMSKENNLGRYVKSANKVLISSEWVKDDVAMGTLNHELLHYNVVNSDYSTTIESELYVLYNNINKFFEKYPWWLDAHKACTNPWWKLKASWIFQPENDRGYVCFLSSVHNSIQKNYNTLPEEKKIEEYLAYWVEALLTTKDHKTSLIKVNIQDPLIKDIHKQYKKLFQYVLELD